MKKIGSFMALIGLAAIVLNFFGLVPKILVWIYTWGDGVAWAIKLGLVAVGAILYFSGGSKEEGKETTEVQEPTE